MTDYFKSGPGKQALGESAPIAVAACENLEKQLTEVAASFTHSGNVADVRTFAEKWAADYPIHHSISGRVSLASYFTKRKVEVVFSAPEAASSLAVTMDDISRRMDAYSGQLPDQARWQAELFAMDLANQYQAENVMPMAQKAVQSLADADDAIDRAVKPFERTAATLESIPVILTKERTAAQQDLHEEITRAFQFEEQELKTTLDQVTKQLTNERVETLLELHRNIAEERTAFTRDLERLSFNVVDHAFLRAAELVAVIAIATFAGVMVLLFVIRRLFIRKHTAG
jgi:hypothetical protein